MTAPRNLTGGVFSSTAFRIAAVMAVLFVAAAALVVSILVSRTNDVLTEQVMASVRAEAATLSREAASGGPAALRSVVAALSRTEGPSLYFLADAAGGKLAGNLSRVPPEIKPGQAGGLFEYAGAREANAAAGTRLGAAMAVTLPGGERLIVGRDIENQRSYADAIRRDLLLGLGGLGVLGLTGVLLVSRHVQQRLERINSAARSIMAGDLARRIELEGNGDEIDALTVNLNAMLDRIGQLMAGLQEVSDNIAHDLKTPLNRLRNRAEAALNGSGGEGACREGLERTIEEADELIKTFNALLLIARLEAGAVQESAAAFDLSDVVTDCVELYEPVAEEAGLGIACSAPPGLTVHANRQLVSQAIANLIDNAIKYSAPEAGASQEGGVSVIARRSGDSIEVVVADRGIGISPEDRDRALRRFVRLEKSRTRPGTGLGLSLVAAVVRLSGGSIRLEDNAPGLRVVLALPAAGMGRAAIVEQGARA